MSGLVVDRSRGACHLKPVRRTRPDIELMEDRLLLAVFTVNTVADTLSPDFTSLRRAILLSDQTPGPNTIDFNLPGTAPFTIEVTSAAAADHATGPDRRYQPAGVFWC